MRQTGNPQNDSSGNTPAALLDLLDGFRRTKVLATAVRLRLFDLLADRGALSAAEATTALGLAECLTHMLLTACCSLGLLDRRHTSGYVEVWLRAPIEELRTREGRAAFYGPEGTDAGALRGVVGVDTRAEFPRTPDLVIDNHGETTAERAADLIMRAVVP
ncbi:methyltransferase family protein [Streptomyces luteolifulvus]|uniref:methyltransferase family protein n=1 Tax=Streptomyces luteolifulvus TaxID=2615112 RepID=UPI0017847CF5|nr:methyltransferase dimerization domain-containing protein [Streptomyces luteolifulvus]